MKNKKFLMKVLGIILPIAVVAVAIISALFEQGSAYPKAPAIPNTALNAKTEARQNLMKTEALKFPLPKDIHGRAG